MAVNFLREELSALATSAHKRGSRLQLRVDVQNVSGSFHLDVFGQGMDHHYTGIGATRTTSPKYIGNCIE